MKLNKNNVLNYFISNFYQPISEKIEKQQKDYGLSRIHSHRHISRCIIYSDWFCDFLAINEPKERLKLYFAIAFHDIGRLGELEDVWENQSYEIYINYIFGVKLDKKIFDKNNELVITKSKSILSDIIHDVDCLDIMRSGTGRGGIMGFDKNYLNLFKEQPYLQDRLISGAWQLINYTDSEENDNVDCLKFINEKIKNEWTITI
jgi:hypothetical protein